MESVCLKSNSYKHETDRYPRCASALIDNDTEIAMKIGLKELFSFNQADIPPPGKKAPSQLYSLLETSSTEVILRAHSLPGLVCGCESTGVSLTSWRSREDSESASTTHCTGLLGKAAGGQSVATWLYTWGRNGIGEVLLFIQHENTLYIAK